MLGCARHLGRMLGLPCAMLLAACSSLLTSEVEAPDVSLAGLGLSKAGLFEQELRLDLRLRNPNDFAIGVDGVRFTLEINDAAFAHGRTTSAVDLPALGETVVPVLVNVPTNDLLDRVMALGDERRIAYRLTGEADLDGLFLGALPFEREGRLELPRLPGLPPPS